jgi:hypothetical protein
MTAALNMEKSPLQLSEHRIFTNPIQSSAELMDGSGTRLVHIDETDTCVLGENYPRGVGYVSLYASSFLAAHRSPRIPGLERSME